MTTVPPPSPRTRVKRLPKRGHYDRATIHAVLDAGFLCHVGYVIDGQPYVTPTIHWREGERLYWHGSSASRMLRKLRGGVPACVTVTLVDGMVLARCGFNHSANYRSVMALGRAHAVTDPAEKRVKLDRLVDHLFPGRAATLRPPTEQELKATLVLGMDLNEASAKIRTGPPKDAEEDLAWPVWAGVLPLRTTPAPPEPDPASTAPQPLPAYLQAALPWLGG